jgi:hypothetical protein
MSMEMRLLSPSGDALSSEIGGRLGIPLVPVKSGTFNVRTPRQGFVCTMALAQAPFPRLNKRAHVVERTGLGVSSGVMHRND